MQSVEYKGHGETLFKVTTRTKIIHIWADQVGITGSGDLLIMRMSQLDPQPKPQTALAIAAGVWREYEIDESRMARGRIAQSN